MVQCHALPFFTTPSPATSHSYTFIHAVMLLVLHLHASCHPFTFNISHSQHFCLYMYSDVAFEQFSWNKKVLHVRFKRSYSFARQFKCSIWKKVSPNWSSTPLQMSVWFQTLINTKGKLKSPFLSTKQNHILFTCDVKSHSTGVVLFVCPTAANAHLLLNC